MPRPHNLYFFMTLQMTLPSPQPSSKNLMPGEGFIKENTWRTAERSLGTKGTSKSLDIKSPVMYTQ